MFRARLLIWRTSWGTWGRASATMSVVRAMRRSASGTLPACAATHRRARKKLNSRKSDALWRRATTTTPQPERPAGGHEQQKEERRVSEPHPRPPRPSALHATGPAGHEPPSGTVQLPHSRAAFGRTSPGPPRRRPRRSAAGVLPRAGGAGATTAARSSCAHGREHFRRPRDSPQRIGDCFVVPRHIASLRPRLALDLAQPRDRDFVGFWWRWCGSLVRLRHRHWSRKCGLPTAANDAGRRPREPRRR